MAAPSCKRGTDQAEVCMCQGCVEYTVLPRDWALFLSQTPGAAVVSADPPKRVVRRRS